VLFVQQTFGRVASTTLQHGQPVWFYFPVLLLLLYPWFPLLIFPGQRPSLPFGDRRVRTLAAVVVFGFVLFSVMLNKLPGYLLPLMPATFVLMGIGLTNSRRPGAAVLAPLMLLGLLPFIAFILPAAVTSGLRSTRFPGQEVLPGIAVLEVAAIIIATLFRKYAIHAAVGLAGIALLWFQFAAFPRLDATASARRQWLANHPVCAAATMDRQHLYGLYYYANKRLPDCYVPATGVVR
jgi:4-amino-4-deoxy-L-arabinose transferase-like glycosyltransferase